MGKNPKLWVRVLSKTGSVRVRVLVYLQSCGSVRVLKDCGFGPGSSS
jgi:hypothetical protein